MRKNFKKTIAMILAVSALSISFTSFAEDELETILTDNVPEITEVVSETPEPTDMSVWDVDDVGVQLFSAETTVVPSGKCGDNLTWTLDNEGTLTISGTGDMTSTPWLPYQNNLKKLILNEGITSIIGNAFYDCRGLTGNLVIPGSITSIGEWAFGRCRGLTGNLIIPDSITSIGSSAFSGCSGFTGNLIIPDSVTSIGSGAFSSCSGFDGNLVIPDSVTSIGNSVFSSCSSLTGDLVIPDSVTSIGEWAFSSCIGLTGNLIIPDSVTSIGRYAFDNCSSFTGELVIPDSVISIGEHAFSGCSGFTGNLVIPDSVTSIGRYAFSICGDLDDMYIPRTEDSIETGDFPNRVHWAYDLSKCTAVINDFTVTGSAITPTEKEITVTSPNGKTLYYGTDYVIDRISNNVNVGTATARIVPPEGGISTSSQDVPFNIVGIDLSGAEVTFPDNITWDGAAVEPEPTVVVDGKTLVKGTDYTITYSNNVFTADDFPTKDTTHTATATIKGIGSYIGSLSKEFEVGGFKPDGWDSVDISLSNLVSVTVDGAFIYNGTEHKPTPKLVYHFVNPTTNVAIDYDMVEGEDFEIVSYEDNINAGEAIVTVEGIGEFKNMLDIAFDISPCELSAATIADIPSFEYCKKDICPDVEIKVGDTVTTNGVDYELSYENNRNRGTATVTITGKGNLAGVTTTTFEITPRDGSKFVYIIWL